MVCQVQFVVFHARLPYWLTLSFEKCVRHSAADNERVNFCEKALNNGNLVAHLGATQNRNERLLRMRHGPAQVFEFLFHQQASGGFLYKFRNPNRGGVRAMCCTESVIDVKV